MDSPWDEDTPNDVYNRDAQWEKIASDFTNAGYREGITAGKEGALQEGFDSGFATTGAPLGRDVGRMRGVASALLALTTKGSIPCPPEAVETLRLISAQLSEIRFSDIVPPDLEAEAHAREHMAKEGEELPMEEDLQDKRNVESLEDMLAGMSASGGGGEVAKPRRPTMQDFEDTKSRLEKLATQLGLQVMLN